MFDTANYPCLSYSLKEDAVYCADCVAFSQAKVLHVTKPLKDWSNAKKQVDAHLTSTDHKTAATRARDYLKVCTKEKHSINEHISQAYKDTVDQNRQALSAIIETIVLCDKQNISLHKGNDEDWSNFMALLCYRAQTDEALKKHLDSAPKNARYISPLIQNELIDICASQVTSKIVEEVKQAGCYTVLADEFSDISTTEQISLCLRYVVEEDGSHVVKEQFVAFIPTRDTTGETLTKKISEKLHQLGLDDCTIVGQGYDGAVNMSGHICGVQARMGKDHPHAVYVHCRNHQLNLGICKSCQLLLARNMYDTSSEVLQFINSSPKRLQVYLDQSDGTRLKKFCPVRWSHKSESIHVLLENYDAILATLETLQEDSDSKTQSKATSFYNSLTSFSFLVSLVLIEAPMQHLVPLTQSLQSTSTDLVKASSHASSTVTLLQKKRNEEFDSLWEKTCKIAEDLDIEVSMPRIAKRQAQRANTPAATPKDYWRRNLYVPFLDHLITELQDRLCTPQPRLAAEHLLPSNISKLTSTEWENIKEEYEPLLPHPSRLDSELDSWKQAIQDSTVPPTRELTEALDHAYDLFPNIHMILKVLLTMPVSTATAERPFSTLTRLKTYLRNTMGDERLTSLALLNIHQKTPISTEKALRDFDSTGHRRIALAFK